jgi:hypothetical protein
MMAVELMAPGAVADKLAGLDFDGARESYRVALVETQHTRDSFDMVAVQTWLDERGMHEEAHDELRSHLFGVWRDIPDVKQVRFLRRGHNDVDLGWTTIGPRGGAQ